eukprot:gene10876-12033_t
MSTKSSKKKGKVVPGEEKNQWVMMVPDEILEDSDDGNKDSETLLYKMPHPKSSQSAVYAFKNNRVYELVKFKEAFRSWFIDNTVQADGSLHMLTEIDPLFLTIQFLEKIASTGKFMQLEQILIDKEYQAGLARLENCLSRSELEKICDYKNLDDFVVYKLSQDKVLSWLSLKVENLAKHLKMENSIHVGMGSCAANFVKASENKEHSHAECVHYAAGLVSDYISESWYQKLSDKLDIKSLVPEVSKVKQENEPPAKRQKLDENKNEACLEDYRDTVPKSQSTKKPTKLTSAQKQLAKVDKTGMKSMNSFFKTKPKAKQ